MWNLLRKKTIECVHLRNALEQTANRADLAPDLQDHLTVCGDCQTAADEFYVGRALLQTLPAQSPWFAARVMSAIAAREGEIKRSLEAWAILPKLAARLTWVSALALLLAGTWLYERPKSTTRQMDTAGESLFEGSTASSSPDDLLASAVEQHP